MKPKEKADELFNHYYNLIQSIGGELGQEILVTILAKQCALIGVDEILNIGCIEVPYWKEVKEIIESI